MKPQQRDKPLEAQKLWLQWVEAAFPDFDPRAYFLPPVHFNRMPMTRQSIAGQEVLVFSDAPGETGQSTPGQASQLTPGETGQLTPGQASQLTPGETGPSNQSTMTAPNPTDPQPKAGQNVPDVPSPPKTPEKDKLSEVHKFWLQWVEAAFPHFESRAYFLPPVYFNRVPITGGGEVRVLSDAPGETGQSTPGQADQSTHGQSGLSTPGETGQSKQPTMTATHPTDPQPKAGQNVLDVPSPPKTPGKVMRLVGRYRQLFSLSRTETTGEECGAPIQDIDDKYDAASLNNVQLVQTAFPVYNSDSFDCIPSISVEKVLVLPKPYAQAGQSTSGQSGQSTPGHSGQSKQPTITAAHCFHPQPKAGQNDPDVQLRPKSPGKVKPSIQDSDVRDDAVSQRILCCLQKMSEIKGEVLVGLSQLQFGQYLGEPCYAAAAAQLPVTANLPSVHPENWKRGDLDVLLIHRHYGLVVCEVKAFGDNLPKLNMSQQDIDNTIRNKLKQAVSQLNKAEAMLSHLVSDVTPGLRITKTIAVPNLTARQVQQAISGDTQLTQDLCRCLGITDPADITALCLCSDQLSDPKTPWDVSSDVLRELGNWWQRRVAVCGPDSHMTSDVYKTLVARFCGPATAVSVPCTSPPRLCVKTLGQAVSWTGECYTAQIALFPEQVDLLNTAPPRLFVAGPPGTGKSVVLLLMARKWMRCGNDVYIVSSWRFSQAACIMLYHLLLQTVSTQLSMVSLGTPHLLQYDFHKEKVVKKAVSDLTHATKKGSLYVITDEVVESRYFQTFCDKLLKKVPDLHLWAASCYHGNALADWQVVNLTRPLRSPPAVVREVLQDTEITKTHVVQAYSARGVADHTDGPPVTRLYHRGQGHLGNWPGDCVTCGIEVALFLHSLRVEENNTTFTTVTTTNGSTTPPCIQWRDVLVLYWIDEVSDQSGVVRGLRKAGIPVRVMKNDDIKDVATARSDVVWVADGDRVRGLERKVVICVDPGVNFHKVRVHHMSRCTSQLVIVSH